MLNSLFIGNQDGGIISTITQAPQSEEPVVIVGLGGTGVDAITRLKTKLHRQIEPDNKDEVTWGLGMNKPYMKASTGFLVLEDPMLRELDYTRMSREDQRFMNTDLYSF